MKKLITLLFLPLVIAACTVSYSFNGASIDYNLVKTIEISDFPNHAIQVYPQLSSILSEELKDHFGRNTKLEFTSNKPDLELEGEITRYDLSPIAVKEDAYASQTRLTIEVRMRYRNNKKPEEDKEEAFTAYRDFDSNIMLSDKEEELSRDMAKEIVEQIFNATMSNW